MIFRFTLSHAILGSQEITAPDGWKDAVLKLERDKNFHSLIEYFDGSFIFYGSDGIVNGGIDFIREVERDYGFDADLNILIEITVDGYTYETVFIGLLKLDAIQETEDNKIQVPIIRNDFWAKFINRLETPVNIQSDESLDGDAMNVFDSINIEMTSQKIKQRLKGRWSTSVQIGTMLGSSADYGILDFDILDFDEIDQKYNYPVTFTGERPFELLAFEYGGELIVDEINISLSYVKDDQSDSQTTASMFEVYLQINNESPIAFSKNNYNLGGGYFFTKYTLITTNLTIEKNDFIYLYINGNGVNGLYYLWLLGEDNNATLTPIEFINENIKTNIDIRHQSEFPETNSPSFLLHDVGGQIADRIISRGETFYSEYLGSGNTIYKQYEQDGCGWKYSLLKGLQLRQYSLVEKPFFLSFKTWWGGANPILNLGLGYEEIDGKEVIRVEEKEHFFDDDISLLIDNVRQIRRVYDPERTFKSVKIGYKQWQSENISGIDDPQTKHTYASRLQKSGTDITLESDFIAASLAIETTRRTTREKSADYKFDNETFIIAINPTPVDEYTSPNVDDYVPELDENFGSITGLLNAETRYNLRITPARNFMRWIAYLSASLQSYLSSTFKFTAGEGNYDMTSDMFPDACDEYTEPLSEKQDIQVYDDPLHLALLYEITVPMEWEDYRTIRDNRKKAIGISQTDQNHVKFFIKELNYEVTKSQATITAWPKEFMEIQVIEYSPAMIECTPRTTFPLTVDNDTITVDSTEYTVDATEYTI